ncbi:hypothetical protein BES34_015875 [Leptospira inadai serovar Lyme]|uniref:Uncharacterized protein n=1 Tax=Leptospira inadai serovar Lyme TaxID=293084 RepID=A0ABX4YFK5_9LEPT|nr:hypothetical protein BES34_015875 [Leptospira inadai serovar Lyme]
MQNPTTLENFLRKKSVLTCYFIPFRRQRTEDRRARFARARQKLLDMGKVTEVELGSTGMSAIEKDSYANTGSFFGLPFSVPELQHNSFTQNC